MTDMELLGDLIDVGVPTATLSQADDLDTKMAELFEVSKRQIREWRQQGAIKITKIYQGFVTLRAGSRAGVLIKVKQ